MPFKQLKITPINLMLVDKYGWPIEQIKGHTFNNWLRRTIHGKTWVCRDCWYRDQAQKDSSVTSSVEANR